MSAPRPPLRQVLGEMRAYRGRAAGAGMATLTGVAAATAGPLLIAAAIDHGVLDRQPAWILACTAGYLGVTVLQALSTYLQVRWVGRLAEGYLYDLRCSLLTHLFELDLPFFRRQRTGALVSRLTSDVDNVRQFLDPGLSVVVQALVVMLMTGTTLIIESPLLAGVVGLVLLPLVFASRRYRRRAFAAQVGVRESVANLLGQVNETLSGIRVVQAYGIERARSQTFDAANARNYGAKVATARLGVSFYPWLDFLYVLGMVAILGVGALQVRAGAVQLGVVVAATLYLGRLFQPVQQLAELSSVLQSAAASFARIFEFRAQLPQLVDPVDAKPFQPAGGAIEIEGLHFRYHAEGPDVLRGVDLRIAPGEHVALVGPSGSGKSTLAALLARLRTPTAGQIRIDGQDLAGLSGASLRRVVVLVPQEGFLFDATVADNIGLPSPQATRGDIEQACAELGILEQLRSLPKGLDTPVVGGGMSLSAGQRQLVTLARAQLVHPRVLILDEATSNVDPITATALETALRRLAEGRTTIMVAHRPATALRADRIVVLEAGQVSETGAPNELQMAGGRFAALMAFEPALS